MDVITLRAKYFNRPCLRVCLCDCGSALLQPARSVRVASERFFISDCLLHFKFSLPSKLFQERKENFVGKFTCCHNLVWQKFGIDFI